MNQGAIQAPALGTYFMSTVVVVKKGGKTVIAADTMTMYGDTKVTAKYTNGRSKILKCGGSYIGLIGSAAHNNVFASIIEKYGRRMSFKGTKDIFETYLRIHPILKGEYFVNVTEDDHDPYESSQIDALIANQHGIFGMYSWREVYEYDRFWAIGSGREYALGSMYVAYDQSDEAEEIATLGIAASCEFDRASEMPLVLHSVKTVKARSRVNQKSPEPAPHTLVPAGRASDIGLREVVSRPRRSSSKAKHQAVIEIN